MGCTAFGCLGFVGFKFDEDPASVRLWNDEDSWLFKAVEDGYDDDRVWRTMFLCDCGFVRCKFKFVLCS
jgi:hypothetical protein